VRIRVDLIPNPDTLMPLTIKPYNLDVSQFTTTPRRKAKFLIENKGEQDFNLTLIDWPREYFDVKLPGKVKAGQTAEAMVIVNEDKIESEFKQSLTIEIDDTEHTRYSVPVERIVRIKDAGK
jgi:hypothetical protein